MKSFTASSRFLAASVLLLQSVALACDPTVAGSCGTDTALGTTVNADFTAGASTQFPASYNTVTYESDGVHLSVTKQGDSPILISPWYIMFGRFEIVFQSATGVGMVSSAILQSDDLDEIDWELLGANPSEAQTNYFGRGETETYDREATVADATATTAFNTYVIDWNEDRIIWEINGVALRTLTYAEADVDTSGRSEYPQTPMQVKIGAWAGGDPSNPSGTITWAGGEINYADGPYTMIVKSVSVQDYSTGSSYSYNTGGNGSWQDITATGGAVLGASSGSSASSVSLVSSVASTKTVASSASSSAAASVASSSVNVAAAGSSTLPSSYETFPTSTAVLSSSSVNTRTGWPWVGTAPATSSGSAAASATSSNTVSLTTSGSSSATASSGASSAASLQAGSSSHASGVASSVASGVASSAVGGASSRTTMVTYATSVITVGAGAASASTGSGSSSGAATRVSTSTAVLAAAESVAATSVASTTVAPYTGAANHVAITKIGIAICAAAGLALAV